MRDIYELYCSGCVALPGDNAALAVLHRLGVQRVGGTPRPQCRLFDSGEMFGRHLKALRPLAALCSVTTGDSVTALGGRLFWYPVASLQHDLTRLRHSQYRSILTSLHYYVCIFVCMQEGRVVSCWRDTMTGDLDI